MEDLILNFDKKSPQNKESKINVFVENNTGKKLVYKFLLGNEGVWNNLRDFNEDDNFQWIPKEDGKYFIMVQAKEKDSKKPYDYSKRTEYIIGSSEENIIKNIYIDKEKIKLGEKIVLEVESRIHPAMYKYWISGKDGWQLIKDYSVDNRLIFTANEPGKHQILVECKVPESQNNFDDFKTKEFEVSDIQKPEITNFKCLSSELLAGEELIFQVDSEYDDARTTLYKFIKIDEKGKAFCIQDYSSKRMVNFIERKPGQYKLLCLARDMYSNNQYDDRAIIVYNVKSYNPIEIKSFTTDLHSPQMSGTKILIKSVVEGGRNLLYRFKIDGNYGEDSGYIRNSSYIWDCKYEGEYKITVWVKDESFEGEFEKEATIDYVIQKKSEKPIRILDIKLDKENNHLIKEPINVKVTAEGENDLKYSFIVYKDGKEKEKIPYSNSNWVDFIPEESGKYELEVRIKDKFSHKEYDCHQIINLKVKEYIEGNIDYILVPSKEYYLVGDTIEIESICQNTKDTLMKYVISVDGQVIEETAYIQNKKLIFSPKRSGKYIIDLFAKNIRCEKGFDCKKEVKIYINEAPPVTETKIHCDTTSFEINKEISFSVNSKGGKEVCYEFYIMEKGNWKIVQRYSRKNYYVFIPFTKGVYKILVLSKSYHKRCSYEDYDTFEFVVEGENEESKFEN